jgi:hypothetical protein
MWLQAIAQPSSDMGKALTEIGALMQDAQLGDQNWIIDVAVRMATIQLSHEALIKILPPPETAHVHTILLGATQDCYDMVEHLQPAIDNFDGPRHSVGGSLNNRREGRIGR